MKRSILLLLVLAIFCGSGLAQKEFRIREKFPSCLSCGINVEMSSFEGERYSLSKIKHVFDKIVKDEGIEFRYAQGFCQQRAQIMSMILNKKHQIRHGRVWIFAPINLTGDDVHLEITDKNGLAENNVIKWRYHVAPIVRAETSPGRFDDYVIDPSIKLDSPILLKEWIGSMRNSNVSEYTILAHNQYYFNFENSGQINGGYYLFEGSFDQQKLVMESGLALNDTAMEAHKRFIQPIQASNKPQDKATLVDLKKLFGNVNNIEYLLAENLASFHGGTRNARIIPNFSHRQIMTKYPDIVVEMRNYYQQRLKHWTGVTNALMN